MGARLNVNIYSGQEPAAESPPPDADVAFGTASDSADPAVSQAKVRQKRGRGRPPGSGKKRSDGTRAGTFRNFSPLSNALLSGIRLTGPEFTAMDHAEIVEMALVGLARTLGNRNPRLTRLLQKADR